MTTATAIIPPTLTQTAAAVLSDADVLRALTRVLDRRVLAIQRRPSDFATLCAVERVDVELQDGLVRTMFVKYLGAADSDHPDKLRRDREALVYQRLLTSEPSLPVPEYHGGEQGLLNALQYVDAWNLKYHGLEHWYTAAQRLGDLHAHFATRSAELRARDFLLRFDEAYFGAWARRAAAAVAQLSDELAHQLDRLAEERYARAAALIARQPATLVHNDLAPKNVIADSAGGGRVAQIYIVDWEMAGVGCGMLDLVHLKYGLDPDADVKMIAAYRGSIAGRYALPEDDEAFATLLAACELHKTLYRLAHAARWQLPLDRVAQWVEEAHRFMSRVETGEGGAA